MYTCSKKLCLALLVVATLLTGCISSLHPLYTKDTIVIDDRIIGEWTKDQSYKELGFDDVTYSVELTPEGDTIITVLPGDAKDVKRDALLSDEVITSLANIGSGGSDSDKWTFERASTILFEKSSLKDSSFVNMGSTRVQATTISITPATPSMAPDGFYVKQVEEKLPYYILTHTEKFWGEEKTTRMIAHMTEINGALFGDFYPYNIGAANDGVFAANQISAHSFAKIEFSKNKMDIYFFDEDKIEDLISKRQIRLRHEKVGIDGQIVITASTDELRSFLGKYGHQEDLYADSEKLTLL